MAEVYIGVADLTQELIDNKSDWEFVRENASGMYVNHKMFLHNDIPVSRLVNLREVFTNKNAFLETDFREGESDTEKDKSYIDDLKTANFIVTYSSLNYGYGEERRNILRDHNISGGQTYRPCFVQAGPWAFDGDIATSKNDASRAMRGHLPNSDGFSTDSPIGCWYDNRLTMKEGSVSMMRYAQSHKKIGVVMIATHDCDSAIYDSDQHWFSTAKSCVKYHEDRGSNPEIWVIFAYGAGRPAVTPETTTNGQPANTLTGFAYWLIKHLRGELE